VKSVYLGLSGRSLSWGRGLVTSIHAGVGLAAQDAAHCAFRQQAAQGFTYLNLDIQYGHALPELLWEPVTADRLDLDWPKDSYPYDPGSGVKLPLSWIPRLRTSSQLHDPDSTTLKLRPVIFREAHL
jgi:hypothetical protein